MGPSTEYQQNSAARCVDQRRRHHLPYILRALAIGRPEKLYPLVDVVNKTEIEAVLNAEERNSNYYWQRLSSEKDDLSGAIALEIIRKKKIDLRTATEEVHAQLEEDIKREFERRMAERRGYAWVRQAGSEGK